MRRVRALCLLAAFAALHAPAVLATVAPDSGEHHHPGCPWEAREEPCPHRVSAPASGQTAWAHCPASEAGIPVLFGPDLAPPGGVIGWAVDPHPVGSFRLETAQSVPATPLRPDPDPPRQALPVR